MAPFVMIVWLHALMTNNTHTRTCMRTHAHTGGEASADKDVPSRADNAFKALIDMVIFRPPLRADALRVLLELTIADHMPTRDLAVRMVVAHLYDREPSFRPDILAFARQSMEHLLNRPLPVVDAPALAPAPAATTAAASSVKSGVPVTPAKSAQARRLPWSRLRLASARMCVSRAIVCFDCGVSTLVCYL